MVPKRKSVVVTFRVDAHLAEALRKIDDKSAFIREAIQQTFHETCPACGGTGRVDCDAARWLDEVLADRGAKRCSCCGTAYPPASASKASGAPRGAAVCGHCGPEGHRH